MSAKSSPVFDAGLAQEAGASEAWAAVPHQGAAFALLGTIQAALTAALSLVLLALPAIQSELGLSRANVVLVTAGPGLAFSGLLLLGGRLGDMVGRRRTFIVGLVIFGAASLVAGLAPRAELLLGARFVQGCGAALVAPAAMALLSDVYPEPLARDRAVAIWGNLSPVGATAGTLLSGLIVTWVSWRWAFAIPVFVAAIAIVAAPRLLPTGPTAVSTRLDVPGAVLATGGLTLVSFGFVQVGEHPWTAPVVVVSLVVGVAFLAAFVLVESRASAPLVPLSFFASMRRDAALVLILLIGAVSATLFFFLALYLLEVRAWPPLQTSAAFLPFGVALFLASAITGRLIGRVGGRVVTASGLLVGACGLFVLSRLEVGTPYIGDLIAGQVIFQLGAGLAFAGATVVAAEGVSDDEAGLAGGIINTAQQTGPTVGLAILVSIATTQAVRLGADGADPATAATSGYALALGIAGVAFVVGAVIAVLALRAPSVDRVE
jgi:EmrB/QacA subfamily drug resistance transporter